jgi:hypothetical protein
MRTSQKRVPRASYRAQVGEGAGRSDIIDLDFDTDIEAVYAAFSASSPFGHALGYGRRFIGYFDSGDGRLDALSPRIHVGSAVTSTTEPQG